MHPPNAFAGHGSPQSRLAADRLRPQFHLLPAANWMNDSLVAESPNPRKTSHLRMFIA